MLVGFTLFNLHVYRYFWWNYDTIPSPLMFFSHCKCVVLCGVIFSDGPLSQIWPASHSFRLRVPLDIATKPDGNHLLSPWMGYQSWNLNPQEIFVIILEIWWYFTFGVSRYIRVCYWCAWYDSVGVGTNTEVVQTMRQIEKLKRLWGCVEVHMALWHVNFCWHSAP